MKRAKVVRNSRPRMPVVTARAIWVGEKPFLPGSVAGLDETVTVAICVVASTFRRVVVVRTDVLVTNVEATVVLVIITSDVLVVGGVDTVITVDSLTLERQSGGVLAVELKIAGWDGPNGMVGCTASTARPVAVVVDASVQTGWRDGDLGK